MNDSYLQDIQTIELFWKYPIHNAYKEILIQVIRDQPCFEVTDHENYFITFYNSSDLIERNQTYEIQQFEPHYLMVGQDGDLGYFISNIFNDQKLYCIDLGALGSVEMSIFADHFQDFFKF